MSDVYFRDQLRSFMKDNKYNLRQVAKLHTMFKQDYIFHWLTGAVLPSLDNLFRFHEIAPNYFKLVDKVEREKLRTPINLLPILCVPCIYRYKNVIARKRAVATWASYYFCPRKECGDCKSILPDSWEPTVKNIRKGIIVISK